MSTVVLLGIIAAAFLTGGAVCVILAIYGFWKVVTRW